jgi:hypothetical protein
VTDLERMARAHDPEAWHRIDDPSWPKISADSIRASLLGKMRRSVLALADGCAEPMRGWLLEAAGPE